MANFEKGERVSLKVAIDGIFSVTVPEGTTGTVREVEDRIFGEPGYDVKFDNGESESVGESQLIPAA